MEEMVKSGILWFLCFWVCMDIIAGIIYYGSFKPCLKTLYKLVRKPKFILYVLLCVCISSFIHKHLS